MRAQNSLDRREFLQAAALAPLVFSVAGQTLQAQTIERPKNETRHKIIHWVFDGGLSQEIWDPKPDSPEEIRGGLGTIQTSIPGAHFADVSPELAKRMDKLTLLRNVRSPKIFHDESTHDLLWSDDKFYLSEYGRGMKGQVPAAYVESSFKGYGDGLSGIPNGVRDFVDVKHFSPDVIKLFWHEGKLVVPQSGVTTEILHTRLQLLRELDRMNLPDKRVQQAQENAELAQGILVGGYLSQRSADPRLAEKYGDTPIGQAALAAIQLARAGFATVDLRFGHWDFHENSDRLFRERFPAVDKAMAAQIDDIQQSEDPIILAASTEFGRDPKMSWRGGREHWLQAHSEIFFGGRIPRGKIIGKTSERWEMSKEESIALKDIKHVVMHGAYDKDANGNESAQGKDAIKKVFG